MKYSKKNVHQGFLNKVIKLKIFLFLKDKFLFPVL